MFVLFCLVCLVANLSLPISRDSIRVHSSPAILACGASQLASHSCPIDQFFTYPVRISFHPFHLFHFQQRIFLLGCGVSGVCCFSFLVCLGRCLGLVCSRFLFCFLFPFASLHALALSLTGAQRTDSSSASKKKRSSCPATPSVRSFAASSCVALSQRVPSVISADSWSLPATSLACSFPAILSNCAESLLLARGKPGRAKRQGTQQIASPPSSKAPSLQTVKERKLRRFARRVVEYQKNPLPQLQEKLVRDGPHLHHSLALFSLDDPRLVGAVLDLANSEAMAASKLRLEAWKDCVQENPTKLGKWVKQLPPACPTASFDGLILPADRAKCAALDWEKHWNPESLPDMNQVDQLCSQLGPATDPLPDDCIQVSGSELARIALKAKDKAPGMDAWTALHLCNLPIAFWEQVGVLWDACLRHGRVPAMWKEVRIAFVTKTYWWHASFGHCHCPVAYLHERFSAQTTALDCRLGLP